MDIPGTVISSLRLGYSVISEQESASEKRRQIYNSVAGQEISFTPEVGDEIELQLRNSALDDDNNMTYLTIAVSDPNRLKDLFKIETDIRFHYLNIYMSQPAELGSPLIDKMNFVELGPEDFKIELRVDSTDPPTLQLAFERIETVLSQIHTEYHQFLRSQYNTYKSKFEVTKNFEDDKMRYKAKSDLNEKELIPQPEEDDFELQQIDGKLGSHDRISIAYYAYEYIKYVVAANAGGEDYFAL